MIRKLLDMLRRDPRAQPASELLRVQRGDVEHLWQRPHGLPRVDWDFANRWIQDQPAGHDPQQWRRAILGACLDEVRDALPLDHRRWRSANVEGLAPLEGDGGKAASLIAERAFKQLRTDLRPITGDAPIAPVAIVLIKPMASLLDFTASYFPEEGVFATFGGLYLNEGPDAIALIAVDGSSPHTREACVVHELTHHALRDCALPLWAEEGLTQMMEERIASAGRFSLDRELVMRHRDRWGNVRLAEFINGSAFSSPEEDTQELAYHLAQWAVRSELSQRPKAFFQFLASCRQLGENAACEQALQCTPVELVHHVVFGS